MVLRVLVARAELFQTLAVTRWEEGEEDRMGVLVDDRRPSTPTLSVLTAALIMPRLIMHGACCTM